MSIDVRTPVIVGVGQAAERIDDAYYQGMSAVELAAAGARAALDDCGADSAKVAASIDTVAGVRQFEISGPAKPVLGKSNNYPRSVTNRIGADPARAILEVVGGQGPQHLITELAGQNIGSAERVADILRTHRPGETLPVSITDRTGETRRGTIITSEDPAIGVVPVEAAGGAPSAAQRAFRQHWLGSRK